ncbi:MAG: hypothetical protein K1X78_28110 [Verrucomicrobiaceae bacterium]|nr:hypothetical protein [Verrucomicrobiaceae bacterium]
MKHLILALTLLALTLGARAQTTVFTYQGHLMDGGASANGNYDIQFTLKDAETAGADVNAPQVVAPVSVVNGIFTVSLNFGLGSYSGSDRWVEMAVRPFGSAAARTVLAPRQKVTSAPYAVRSFISSNAQSLIGPISGSNIPAGTIISSMIAPGAITSSQIAPGTVNPAIAVNSASQTAAAGTVYNANHFDLSTFNLPASATVGEVIEINGVGSGGWSTAAAWIARDSARNWSSIASSSDGQRLVAVVSGGQIYTSDTYGVTWTPRDSSRTWVDVASSSDGAKLVAAVDGGGIYTSTDYGANWTLRAAAGNRDWEAVASSADGTRLVAVTVQFGAGSVFTSTDSGTTWTERTSAGARPWNDVACSADGMRIVAVPGSFGGGQVYTSQDGGATWTARLSVQDWFAVACSDDGNFIVAAQFGGQIRTSHDSGSNWSASGPSANWNDLDCSADGRVIIACASSTQLHISVDHGTVWNAQESGRFWEGVTCSADGSKRAACDFTGQIYTSYGGYSGGGGTSAKLQYTGSGIWTQVADASEAAKVNRAGDTMTGTLSLPANGLRVGGSQLVTSGGLTGIGTATPEPGFTMTLGGTPALGSLDGLLMLRDRNGANQWNLTQNSADGSLFLIKPGGSGFIHTFGASGNVGIKTDAPTATLDVNGSTRLRDVMRQGSETGTSEAPGFGVITRRVSSTNSALNQVAATTPTMSLERDGTNGGWMVRVAASSRYTIAAMGMNSAGTAVNYYSAGTSPAGITLYPVYTDAQNVVFFRLQFGDPYHNLHLTEVTLSRDAGDNYWVGTMISTYNQ